VSISRSAGFKRRDAGSTLRRLGLVAPVVGILAAGCTSSARSDVPTPETSPTAASSLTLAASVQVTGPAVDAPQLIVLADGVVGDVGLWTFGSDGSWSAGRTVPGATAIGRDGQLVTLSVQGALELRDVARPQDPRSTLGVQWASAVPRGTVACVDRSDSGRTVIAVSDANDLAFAVVSAQGAAALLSPVPESPFGPSVAWLDADRIVALSADARQIPRLTVLDTAKGSTTALQGLSGVRVFAVSPDRLSLAAATESSVYVAPVVDWLAAREPTEGVNLKPSQIVWDLALSADGSRLAMLSGTERADGTVADIREIGYERRAGAWAQIFDAAVPFTHASGQVWLI
jgi:hypothetical protein